MRMDAFDRRRSTLSMSLGNILQAVAISISQFPLSLASILASAELAIMPTIINNPPIIVKVTFMFASVLSILDISSRFMLQHLMTLSRPR